MSDLGKARREEIRARAEKATKGPWEVKQVSAPEGWCDGIVPTVEHTHPPSDTCWDVDECPGQEQDYLVQTDSGAYGPRIEDAEFIAHARTDVPDLLSALEKGEADRNAAIEERDLARKGRDKSVALAADQFRQERELRNAAESSLTAARGALLQAAADVARGRYTVDLEDCKDIRAARHKVGTVADRMRVDLTHRLKDILAALEGK